MNPGEKRVLNAKCSEGKRPRPTVSSNVLAELQKDECLHGFDQRNFEALIRSAVAEEIEHVLSRVASAFQGGAPLQQARKFRLQFETNPAAKCFTENNLKNELGDSICVILIDPATGQPVTNGPESLAELEVVPLMGGFITSEEQEWSTEEFERHVAKEREGKGPLLVGDLKVHLRNGVGTLGQMYFTDNSSFTRSKKFRLGVQVAQDEHGLMSVREGKSQAFSVIDSRGKAYKKHDTPSPTDDVWRLRNIGKDGPYHTKLRQNGMNTVKDFLYCLETRPELLKDVLGKMSEKAYQDTIDHANKCVRSDKIYIYPVEQPPYESLIFKANYQVAGAVAQGHYVGLEKIDGIEKVHIDGLVRSAYHHWDTDVTECAVEGLSEPSMIVPPGAIDRSFADDMVHVDAAPQEAIDGSLGPEGVLSLEPITGQGYVDGNVTAEWGFDMENWSEDLRIHREQWQEVADKEGVHPQNIASQVQYVVRQEYGEPFELFALDDPSPPVGKWWLRIRSVVRCALFIRRAGFARS